MPISVTKVRRKGDAMIGKSVRAALAGLAVISGASAARAEVVGKVATQPIAAGDTFTVTAGCDKQFATCHDRFDNVVNFRGFPHIPGNDFVVRYPVAGEPGNDGKSMQQ